MMRPLMKWEKSSNFGPEGRKRTMEEMSDDEASSEAKRCRKNEPRLSPPPMNEVAFRSICNDLNRLRSTKQLCDAILVASDKIQFYAHRLILYTSSPYFKEAFKMTEKLETIKFDDISSKILEIVLDYFYTNKLRVEAKNCKALMDVAIKFDVSSLLDACFEFLMTSLHEENCVDILILAKRYNNSRMIENTLNYIKIHFNKVPREQLVQMELLELSEVMECDHLNTPVEEQVLESVISWTEHDLVNRRPSLPWLLKRVRLELCSMDFLIRILRNPLVTADCQAICQSLAQILTLQVPVDRTRVPHELLFVVGGWNAGSATNLVEVFSGRCNPWVMSRHADSVPRAYHGIAAHGGHIYVIGGFDGQNCVSSVRRFETESRVWRERGCMHEPRCYVSVAVLPPYIYALGGYDGHSRTKTGERYLPETNQWLMISSMSRRRSDASSATLHGFLYIAGGFDGQEVMNSVERYSPETDSWTVVESMLSPRSGVSLVSYRDTLWAMGGWDGRNRLVSCEKLDILGWRVAPNMITPRSNFATAILENRLYVIGGFNGTTTIPYVEVFNDRENMWQSTSRLNVNRSALGSCVLRGLANIRDFISNAGTTQQH